jgi:hypothetical protein
MTAVEMARLAGMPRGRPDGALSRFRTASLNGDVAKPERLAYQCRLSVGRIWYNHSEADDPRLNMPSVVSQPHGVDAAQL